MAAPKDRPTIISPPNKTTAPPVCTQQAITVPPAVAAKTRQKHPWMTQRWYSSWNRRNRVEGWNGNLKDGSREHIAAGRIRVFGIAKVTLLIAAASAACNLRLRRKWEQRETRRLQDAATDPFTTTPSSNGHRTARRQKKRSPYKTIDQLINNAT